MRKFSFNSNDDFSLAVALNLVEGVNSFAFNGTSRPLSSGVSADLTLIPGIDTILLPSDTGEQLVIVSDSTQDTGSVTLHLIGPDGVYVDPVTVQLNGTTPVNIPGLMSRINFIISTSIEGVIGTVTVTSSNGLNIYSIMTPEFQLSNQGMYTVPSGYAMFVSSIVGTMRKSSGSDTDVTLSFSYKKFSQVQWYVPFGFGLQRSGDTSIEFSNSYPSKLDGPLDIKVTALSSANGSEVAARLNGLIIKI